MILSAYCRKQHTGCIASSFGTAGGTITASEITNKQQKKEKSGTGRRSSLALPLAVFLTGNGGSKFSSRWRCTQLIPGTAAFYRYDNQVRQTRETLPTFQSSSLHDYAGLEVTARTSYRPLSETQFAFLQEDIDIGSLRDRKKAEKPASHQLESADLIQYPEQDSFTQPILRDLDRQRWPNRYL